MLKVKPANQCWPTTTGSG